jgi:hydroxymethylpyrimidine/phosphomethylpyrimidine kinase
MDLSEFNEVTLYPEAIALTIAGSDPSGGAGLQADLKTFQQLGVFGATAVTLITVQNTVGVEEVQVLPSKLVLAQIDAVAHDLKLAAAKTGALGDAEVVEAVADRCRTFDFPLVVDPVMVSKHGDHLLDEDGIELMRRRLLPKAFLVTPNRWEASLLAENPLDDPAAIARAIHDIHQLGARYVLLKLGEEEGQSIHILGDGQQNLQISVPRLDSRNTHGSGCALSAAITARLARQEPIREAVHAAIRDVWQAIHAGQALGSGYRPIEFRMIGTGNSSL